MTNDQQPLCAWCGFMPSHPFHTDEAYEIPGMLEQAHQFQQPMPSVDDARRSHSQDYGNFWADYAPFDAHPRGRFMERLDALFDHARADEAAAVRAPLEARIAELMRKLADSRDEWLAELNAVQADRTRAIDRAEAAEKVVEAAHALADFTHALQEGRPLPSAGLVMEGHALNARLRAALAEYDALVGKE